MALCCCYHVIPRGIGEKLIQRMGAGGERKEEGLWGGATFICDYLLLSLLVCAPASSAGLNVVAGMTSARMKSQCGSLTASV